MLVKENQEDWKKPKTDLLLTKIKLRKKETFYFSYQDVGSVIQGLINDFYQHKFNKLPFSSIDDTQTEKILKDTDSIGKVSINFKLF